ncbi:MULTISPECIES: hypothetical protein [Curtobacterium]|jgi:hypothetical protein|uniref:Uncharacterized protein n=2 Tax=Curtobacterium TaxID=2034 RepID=A0A5P8YVQ9_9MICO|nr:hypothetical protein [Curtobacterium flaccumfaciens]MBO9041478.1 hypothetical protein [Curtobacterium flaccumfaciens pv. flaccumfaciens]MBO9044964.1 hypothetical protein [Curtobacterium flaccumfaciens pv. flaccumfaciens]MBO9048893.1 hypothetical protein [Curtobacterium flaccumfaciens pv. flaccumfaciens]MBO9057744.1 hypothetical protein [Curtobacterium flaccumfaciens pv. flaccumfaciens]MBT1543183.1 hypothetical protein [Curtobacterium flaccumfaciens pv. flaccumfaciens]
MSKQWKWSDDSTIEAFLPTGVKHEVQASDANRFLAAGSETQFEVMLVLREQARGHDRLIPSLSFIFSAIAVLLSGFNVLSTRDLGASVVIVLFLLICMVGVAVIGRDVRKRSTAAKWHDAYAYALQHAPTKQARRWFSRAR